MKVSTDKKKAEKKQVEQVAIIEQSNELGNVQIHDNVISTIVRKTVLETEGVARLAGSSVVDSIGEVFGSRKISSRAIAIIHEDDKVTIEIKVNILFGFKIPDVSKSIQTEVIQEVENITGINVSNVGVIIQEIEELLPIKEEPQPEEDIITE
ncbi:MAG: Asp23/Gls24 family envelope stress response protein [Victivallaceae bacterium]|nr:Asp23/Gls24 family envelope stress response protein [Victivallaceae bacterium]